MLDQLPLVRGIASLVERGGPFVLCIFSAGVLMWAMVLERYWYFWRILPEAGRRGCRRMAGPQRPHVLVRAADPARR